MNQDLGMSSNMYHDHHHLYGGNSVDASSYLDGSSSYHESFQPQHAMEQQQTQEPQPSTSRDQPQAPTYDDVFPALPESDDLSVQSRQDHGLNNFSGNNNHRGSYAGNASNKPSASNQIMKLKSTNVVRMYRVPSTQVRGDKAKTCMEIMTKTNTTIEICTAKDFVTFTIRGKEEAVNQAKILIGQQLQTQSSLEIPVKKELHKFILGKLGKKLLDLQEQTGTKISVPKADSSSDMIKIVGHTEGIQKVVREINVLCQELGARASERIDIEKEYHPFINGAFGETVKEIIAKTGAKINVPPPSVDKSEIHISGETNAVAQAKEAILSIVREKKKKCSTIQVEIKKPQHRYVIGPKGATLQEILKETGVSIEMPPSENPSETITLRGEQADLGNALNMLYKRANSEIHESIDAPSWLQRHILGPKGAHFQEISQEFHSTVNVSFAANENVIKIHGPKEDVEKAKEVLEAEVRKFKKELCLKEVKVDPKYHRFLIGKGGQTINQIRTKTGAQITIPTEDDKSSKHSTSKQSSKTGGADVILIEGTPSEVERAKIEIEAIIKKQKDTDSRELVIEQRFHRQIIGTKGETIKEVRDKFNQVIIAFPETNTKSDKVTVRGPKRDVEACCKHLLELSKELEQNNYRIEVPIFKEFTKFLKDGSRIRKIREETNTKIDLPAEGSDVEVIVISGKKKDVELAKQKVQAFQNELTNAVQVDIIIPSKFHNAIIGAKGRLIRSIMEENGGVVIKFPAEGSGSDKVSIRGPKDCVAKAKAALVELSNDKQENGHTLEVKAKPEHHKFLIGKNGANIRKVRESTGARVIFPSDKDDDKDTIVIIGKKNSALKAKTELEAMIKELDKIVEDTVEVPNKHHAHFVVRKGAVLRQIQDEFGGVNISFPGRADTQNSKVVIKGAKECVAGAKAKILQEVARLESLITLEVEIDSQHHRSIMGMKGNNVKKIQSEHNVEIKFPERRTANGTVNGKIGDSTPVNGVGDDTESVSSGGAPSGQRKDIIVLVGTPDECESVKKALLALIPVEENVDVPFDYHRFIIGQKGKDVKELMDRFDVSISIPPSQEQKDTIKITGSKENIRSCKQALLEKVSQLDDEKKERELKSFRVEIHVNPELHPKIIGKKGIVINKIRSKFGVVIQFPERSSKPGADQSLITITGYEDKVIAARDHILSFAKDFESQVSKEVRVDARVHSRLIGQRGKNVRGIMQKFSVDVKFPREGAPDPNMITITGQEEDVEAAKDHILNLEEEYLEDEGTEYAPPKLATNTFLESKTASGFVVKGAPWEAPDTSNNEEFPSFGPSSSSDAKPVSNDDDHATATTGNGPTVWKR